MLRKSHCLFYETSKDKTTRRKAGEKLYVDMSFGVIVVPSDQIVGSAAVARRKPVDPRRDSAGALAFDSSALP
jgi:hypothetical protein